MNNIDRYLCNITNWEGSENMTRRNGEQWRCDIRKLVSIVTNDGVYVTRSLWVTVYGL